MSGRVSITWTRGDCLLGCFFLFMLPAQAVGLQEFHEEKIKSVWFRLKNETSSFIIYNKSRVCLFPPPLRFSGCGTCLLNLLLWRLCVTYEVLC